MKKTSSARPATSVNVYVPRNRYKMSGDITKHIVKAAKATVAADAWKLHNLAVALFMKFPLSSTKIIVDADLAGVAPEAADAVLRAAKSTDASKRENLVKQHMSMTASGSREESEAWVGAFGRA